MKRSYASFANWHQISISNLQMAALMKKQVSSTVSRRSTVMVQAAKTVKKTVVKQSSDSGVSPCLL